MRSGLIRPPGTSALMVLRMLRVGAGYSDIVRHTSGEVSGIGGAPEGYGGRVGRTGAMEPEEPFFVVLVFSLVSKINFSSLQKGKGGMR